MNSEKFIDVMAMTQEERDRFAFLFKIRGLSKEAIEAIRDESIPIKYIKVRMGQLKKDIEYFRIFFKKYPEKVQDRIDELEYLEFELAAHHEDDRKEREAYKERMQKNADAFNSLSRAQRCWLVSKTIDKTEACKMLELSIEELESWITSIKYDYAVEKEEYARALLKTVQDKSAHKIYKQTQKELKEEMSAAKNQSKEDVFKS